MGFNLLQDAAARLTGRTEGFGCNTGSLFSAAVRSLSPFAQRQLRGVLSGVSAFRGALNADTIEGRVDALSRLRQRRGGGDDNVLPPVAMEPSLAPSQRGSLLCLLRLQFQRGLLLSVV